MFILDIELKNIPNYPHSAKSALLVNNKTGVAIPMIKISTDKGCLEAVNDIIDKHPNIKLLFGRRADNCNNYSSPTIVSISEWVAGNRGCYFIVDIDIYDSKLKNLCTTGDRFINVGKNKDFKIVVTNRSELEEHERLIREIKAE